MLNIARTTASAVAGGALFAAGVLAELPANAMSPGVPANLATPLQVTPVKGGGGGGGGGGAFAGSNDWVLDIPQPDYSRPNLDYNLPSPGPHETFKSRAAYCKKTFKSYDPKTGTYIGKDGRRHHCQ